MSCGHKNSEDSKIVIQFSQGYKIDVNKEVFSTLFASKPPYEVKFTFTKSEKDTIWEKYHSLPIDFDSSHIYLNDTCSIAPKPYTIIEVTKDKKTQRIYFSNICNGFRQKDMARATKINSFIKSVQSIVDRKPGIKNAPMSDIMYY